MARNSGKGATVKSAERVLRILELVAAKRNVTFIQVASDLALPSSSTHALLQTMLSERFLEFDGATRRYRLGRRAWEVGRAYAAGPSLASRAQPLLERLTRQTTETAHLVQLDGLEAVYIAVSESSHPMRFVSDVGTRLPAHCTAAGKALLAELPNAELRRTLDGVTLPRLTASTIVELDDLLAELERTKARGYGVDNEENNVGCRCLAVLVRDENGTGIAAISVAVPTARHDSEFERLALASLNSCAADLSAQLGFAQVRDAARHGPRAQPKLTTVSR